MDENNQDIDLVNNETVEVAEDTSKTDAETVDWKRIAEEKIAEASKFRAILDRQKKKQIINSNPKETDDELVSRLSKLEQIESKRQFGFENGLSPEETDFIFQATGGKPSKDALETPFIKHGLEGYRQSKRVENNTPNPSSRSLTYQGKEFSELTTEEKQKAFAERTKNLKK